MNLAHLVEEDVDRVTRDGLGVLQEAAVDDGRGQQYEESGSVELVGTEQEQQQIDRQTQRVSDLIQPVGRETLDLRGNDAFG